MIKAEDIEIVVASEKTVKYVDEILDTITRAAKVRGTGIATRSPEYVKQKMLENKAVVALYKGEEFAGFSYIESWSNKQFVANSVMKINNKLGFRPVTFDQLTDDEAFWKGCESCVNFDILQRNGRRMCLCTGLLYDPDEHPDDKYREQAKEKNNE